ncbi:MAG: penicillin-binding protein 2 [Planctomycetota bacterium]
MSKPAPPKRPDGDLAARAKARADRVGRVAVVALSVVLLLLLGRVAQLQSRPSLRVAELIDSQVSVRPLAARRGALTDRRHRPLATTRVAHVLFVDPDIVADPNTFSETVGYSLGYEPAEIEKRMFQRRGSRYIVIDPEMSDAVYARYQASETLQELRGLSSHETLVRRYPQGSTAGQLVGFTGFDGDGLAGLELAYDDRLAADPGQHAFVYDRGRNRLWLANRDYRLQADGRPIRLSLDLHLQAIAEEELAATVAEFHAAAGQLVVMDPTTGEVLALANYPFFDPGDFRDEDGDVREDAIAAQRNRAVTDVFEPGSIVKPMVWAAAVEAGLADPDEIVDCTEDGWWKPERGPVLRDSDHGPGKGKGEITFEKVLIVSSNIGMARVAERMGKTALHRILTSYGLGAVTGSGLPGEVPGMLRGLDDWSWADLTRMPMGHGLAATPLQITRAFCALANDGVLINPTIEARNASGPQASRTAGQVNITARVLSPRVAEHTRRVMGRSVSEGYGTGRHARSDLYDLFGKTGTAELPNLEQGGYHEGRYVSSFIAGAPLESPRLVVGCFVHDTKKATGHYGGTVSGPAVRRVMERSLQYLGVPPKASPAETQHAAR